MSAQIPAPSSDIKELLERNIALSEEILKHAKKAHHHLMWSRFFGIVKLGIIAAPIIAAAWFLPQYFRQAGEYASNAGEQFSLLQRQFQQLGNLQQDIQKQMPNRK